jgi:6-phosphofructokinase
VRVAILTSGSYALGMNGVVRAAARTEFSLGWEVLDVADGFSGLTSGPFRPLILQERPDSGVVCRQVLG